MEPSESESLVPAAANEAPLSECEPSRARGYDGLKDLADRTDEQILEQRPCDLFVIWNLESGIWVSPNMSTLPISKQVPARPVKYEYDIPMDDTIVREPTWFNDSLPWIGFWPRHPLYTGKLFHRLDINRRNPPIRVWPEKLGHRHAHNPNLRYAITRSVTDAWKRLEHALIYLGKALLSDLRDQLHVLTPLKPPEPSSMGYEMTYSSYKDCRLAALNTIHMFHALIAYVSFAIALYQSFKEVEDPQPFLLHTRQAWAMHMKKDSHQGYDDVWLQYMADSMIGDFSPGSRPGAFVDASRTTASCFLVAYERFTVPLMINWGLAMPKTIRDRSVYLTAWQPTVHEIGLQRTEAEMAADDPSLSSYPPLNEAPALVDRDKTTEGLMRERAKGPVNTRSTLSTSPRQLPHRDISAAYNSKPKRMLRPGSGQLDGESCRQFIDRMRLELQFHLAHAPVEEQDILHALLTKAKEASQDHKSRTPPHGSFMWKWIRRFDVDVRVMIPHDEWEFAWKAYPLHCRFYNPITDSWDLEVDDRPGSGVPDDHMDTCSLGDYESDDDGGIENEQENATVLDDGKSEEEEGARAAQITKEEVTFLMPYKRLLHPLIPALLYERYSFLPQLPYATPVGFEFQSFLDYLRQDLRRRRAAKSQEKGRHRNRQIQPENTQMEHAWTADEKNTYTYLGLRSLYDDEVDETIRKAVFDLFNYVVSPESPCRQVPSPFTLDQDLAKVIHHPRHRLDVICPRFRDEYYILGSSEPIPFKDQHWLLAVKDATTVVQLTRDMRRGIVASVQYLVARGIPFRTVKPASTNAMCEPPKTRYDVNSNWVGRMEKGHQATLTDYGSYCQKLNEVLGNPAIARQAVMEGGILWRLTMELVPINLITSGPTKTVLEYGERVDRFGEHKVLVDDALTENERLMLVGTYAPLLCEQDQNLRRSWWPPPDTWNKSAANLGYWTPDNEAWFQRRLKEIQEGRAELKCASQWRNELRGRKRFADAFKSNMDAMNRRFLRNFDR